MNKIDLVVFISALLIAGVFICLTTEAVSLINQ